MYAHSGKDSLIHALRLSLYSRPVIGLLIRQYKNTSLLSNKQPYF